ncbi:MAG: 50S ribosomal protein L18e [Candidatus Aenigmatarchaeota archaeon]
MKKSGPTNKYLKELIEDLKRKSFELNAPIWKAVAEKLENPRRKRVVVNLSDINRNTNEGDTVIVPGVVLSSGNITKKLKIAALRFSSRAKEKIKNANCEAIEIKEIIKWNPKGSGIKIIT